MKQHLTAQKLVLTLALLACSICIFSFRQNDSTQQKTFRKESAAGVDDTTRPKRDRSENEFRLRDLEVAMRHLDEQMVRLDEQMKKIDFSKMEKDLAKAGKISSEKIAKEVEESLAKVDWNKMQIDINRSLDKVKNVDVVKLKEDLNKMKVDLSKQNFDVKINSEKIKKDVSAAMEKAKVSMEKAKGEMKLMNEFTSELEQDKLIDKKKPFKIEVKDGELYIDEKKQPKNVSDKYRKYYRKQNFSISHGGKGNEGIVI